MFLLNKCALTEFTVISYSLSVCTFIPKFNIKNNFESLDLNMSSKYPQKKNTYFKLQEFVQEIYSKSFYSLNKPPILIL